MKWIAKGLLACVFGVIGAASTEAATVRYEFNVVDVDLGFGEGLFPSDPNFNEVIDSLHPLASLQDQNFSGVVDLSVNEALTATGNYTGPDESVLTISCISGLICVPGTEDFVLMPRAARAGVGNSNLTSFQGNHSFSSDYAIVFGANSNTGSGTLRFVTDILPTYYTTVNNRLYEAQAPSASFTLSNLVITPVPLPASALLLGAGLIPLAAARRRKNRV